MKNKYIAKSIVRNADGSINLEQTNQKYETLILTAYGEELEAAEAAAKKSHDEASAAFGNDLQEYVATRAKWDDLSSKHILAAFSRFAHTTKGGCIAKGTLVSMTTAAMLSEKEVAIADAKKAGEMVAAYIDDNKGVIFEVTAGANGGVRLIKSDDAIRA